MRDNRNATLPQGRAGARLPAGILALLLLLLLLTPFAAAQQAPEPQAPPAVRLEPESRGLFESIGRWLDRGTAGFRSHLQGAQQSVGNLNEQTSATTKQLGETASEVGKNAVGAGIAAADAVGAVARLPLSRVINGRERCPQAANGAPDCLAAAETLCRKQGYATGKSIDFTSAEQCTARAMVYGQQAENECTTVTFISRAMCQ